MNLEDKTKLNVEKILEKVNFYKQKANITKEIEILPVIKYFTEEQIKVLVKVFKPKVVAENIVQTMLKRNDLYNELGLQVDMIGNLQTNKIKYLSRLPIRYIHSIYKEKQLKFLSEKLDNSRIFIEYNPLSEDSKTGLRIEDEVFTLVNRVLEYDNIEFLGLMNIAPFVEDEKMIRESFSKTRILKEKLEEKFNLKLKLSMGMSSDFHLAILEGSDILRIGSAFVL